MSIFVCSVVIIIWFLSPRISGRPERQNTNAIGSIGGVSVSIPRGYIYFPIDYAGEDIWSGKRLAEKPTLDTPISTFSLLVRLPGMSPRTPETEAERSEAIKRANTNWIDVQVEGSRGGKEETPWVKAVAGRIRDGAIAEHWVGWHYEKSGSKFGLVEEVLVGASPEMREKNWISDRNLMYDAGTWSTYIQCNTNELKHRMRQRCRQVFSLKPQINAYATAYYDSEHLKDWKIIQAKLSQLIYGFIVPGRTPSSGVASGIQVTSPSRITLPLDPNSQGSRR